MILQKWLYELYQLQKYKKRRKKFFVLEKMPTFAVRKEYQLQGKVLEWLKRHAWKACNRQKRFGGSNPPLSADKETDNIVGFLFSFYAILF